MSIVDLRRTHYLVSTCLVVSGVSSMLATGHASGAEQFVGVGTTFRLFDKDVIGITSEFFYRIQFTQNLRMSPDIQITYKASFNLEKDWVTVVGLRFRLVF